MIAFIRPMTTVSHVPENIIFKNYTGNRVATILFRVIIFFCIPHIIFYVIKDVVFKLLYYAEPNQK